jgi:DNA polymerase-3 subunit epsilon
MAHFAGSRAAQDKLISQAVKRIEWIETAGELGAFFAHTRLSQALAPKYGRPTGRDGELWAWHWRYETPEKPPELVAAGDAAEDGLTGLYGAFRSRASALAALRGLAAAYALCRASLGLERPGEAKGCSAHAAGRCRGACVGAESALSHAMRVAQALAGLRVRPWPYAGRIGIRERDPDTGRSEVHVIDRWRHLGTAHDEAQLAELVLARPRSRFDAATYRMVARILKSPPAACRIVPLGQPAS